MPTHASASSFFTLHLLQFKWVSWYKKKSWIKMENPVWEKRCLYSQMIMKIVLKLFFINILLFYEISFGLLLSEVFVFIFKAIWNTNIRGEWPITSQIREEFAHEHYLRESKQFFIYVYFVLNSKRLYKLCKFGIWDFGFSRFEKSL